MKNSFFEMLHPEDPLVPYFVIQDWIDKCEPGLMESVERDYVRVQEELFRGKKPVEPGEKKLAFISGGSPCSWKSTILDQLIKNGEDPRRAKAVFTDPDRKVMHYMYTYLDMKSAGDIAEWGPMQASKRAYDRSRPGSNIISNTVLNEMFDGEYHIVLGTTLTSPASAKMLQKLGEAGYERCLVLCSAHDSVRIDSGHRRISGEAHYQVDPTDFVEKGELFPQRHHDTYFTYGDHLILMWAPQMNVPAIRAAEYKDGERIILDDNAFSAYVRKYELDRRALAKKDIIIPPYEDVEQLYFARFAKPEVKVEVTRPRLAALPPLDFNFKVKPAPTVG